MVQIALCKKFKILMVPSKTKDPPNGDSAVYEDVNDYIGGVPLHNPTCKAGGKKDAIQVSSNQAYDVHVYN